MNGQFGRCRIVASTSKGNSNKQRQNLPVIPELLRQPDSAMMPE